MTTSLPTSPAADALAGSGAGATATPGLLDLLAATNTGPSTHGVALSPAPAPTGDFAALLGPTAPGKPAGAALPVADAAETAASPAHAWRHQTAAQHPSVTIMEPRVALHTPPAATEPATESPATGLPIDRSTLEAAVALVLNLLPPPAPEVAATPVAVTSSGDAATPAPTGDSWSGIEPAATSVLASAASGAEHLRLKVKAAAGERLLTVADVRESGVLPPSAPAIAVAAAAGTLDNGAKPAVPSPASAGTAPSAATSAWSAVQAEVEWEGGVKLVAELAPATPTNAGLPRAPVTPHGATVATGSLRAPRAMEPMGAPARENSADSTAAFGRPVRDRQSAVEKNFLTPAALEVTTASPKAGIDVAQLTPAMSTASQHSLPVAAATTVVPAGVPQRTEPATALAPEATAQHAVETVLEIVHAQTVAKLQPMPSVQLRFKVGQEDLAVRVRLREGTVQTEFRTDNPELRAALTQEWRAVTARPEVALRFLDPVITGTTSSTPSGGAGSFSGQGGAASQHQQQHAHQEAPQLRLQGEVFGSVRRVMPTAPASAELVPIVPPVASVSPRLSAVA